MKRKQGKGLCECLGKEIRLSAQGKLLLQEGLFHLKPETKRVKSWGTGLEPRGRPRGKGTPLAGSKADGNPPESRG